MKWLLLSLFGLGTVAFAQSNGQQVLVVSGLNSEANVASGAGILNVLSGGSPTTLQTALAAVDPSTIKAVVSFGVAGGLSSKLKPGRLVIGTGVIEVETGVMLPTDANLTAQLLAALKANHVRATSGLEAAIQNDQNSTTAAQKAALGAQTGALAIDNESMVSAQWAQANNLPFVIIRSIDDPQSLTVPPAALVALNPDGSTNIDAILQSLAQDPGQIWSLIEVGIDEGTALNSLQRAASVVDLSGL